LSRDTAPRGRVVLLVCLLACLAIALAHRAWTNTGRLTIAFDRDILPANGYATAKLSVRDDRGRQPSGLTWRVLNGRRLAQVDVSDSESRIRAGVTPGIVTLAAFAPGYHTATAELQLGLDPTDEFGDGTPDFLRLQSEEDRIAFRRWFTFLSESVYFQKEGERPSEINDCAALIRFAYREALRKHDALWANQWHLAQLPASSQVRKYEYPHTALAAKLFRTRPGAFEPDDITNGAFAEFADSDALRRYNTHFVSRDLKAALPGDLLFYRQQGHRMPFHTMVYVGHSDFGTGSDWLIYHTGPDNQHAGEIRRVTAGELQQHPEFCWRPLPQNPAFLGVYRWNILREEE
jgi:uncharacterized protein YfaT (DUF1175 family)